MMLRRLNFLNVEMSMMPFQKDSIFCVYYLVYKLEEAEKITRSHTHTDTHTWSFLFPPLQVLLQPGVPGRHTVQLPLPGSAQVLAIMGQVSTHSPPSHLSLSRRFPWWMFVGVLFIVDVEPCALVFGRIEVPECPCVFGYRWHYLGVSTSSGVLTECPCVFSGHHRISVSLTGC